VRVRFGDGRLGWLEHAQYDRVIVAAAAEGLPQALVDQLGEDGIIAVPLGTFQQDLHVLRKRGGRLETLATIGVRFVPLVRGEQ
jgi:protein-L-isoaspartate(D-aspartate) O-methyltransferase